MLRQFVQDLIASEKSEWEMTRDLETYYDQLTKNCDNEIIDLKEQLEIEKAGIREEAAEEVFLKANELDDLSNIFIDCIHSHRKTLRNQLIRIKTTPGNSRQQAKSFEQSRNSLNATMKPRPNLLETYLRIVQTGGPEEIEKFSQVERQKLVELLVTNQELLNFMFDKMFRNYYDPKERE